MELEEHFFYEHLDQIIDNTYQVLVKQMEIEDVLEDDTRIDMFLFNPMEGFITKQTLDDIYGLLIEHYEEDENYERCQKLLEQMQLDEIQQRERI